MQRRALVVGVSQYSKLRSLGSFVNNANTIADILEPTFRVKRLPEAIDGGHVVVAKGSVTFDHLQNELKELFTATDLDTVLFYFSGHGLLGKQPYPKTYLATSESEILDDGYRRAIEIDLIKQFLRDCPAKEQIVWLDCCYGGGLTDFRDFAGVCDRNDDKTRFIIAASRSQDPAYQEITGEMGVFTRVLAVALARTGEMERRITCASIEDAVREKLQSLQYPQMPQFYRRSTSRIIEFWDREKIIVPETEGNDAAVDKQIANLKKEKEDLLETISLQQNLEDIERKVKAIEMQIESLQKKRLLYFRELWKDKLSEIDFNNAKTLIYNIKENYLSRRNHRYAILLLDNTIAMEGDAILRWLESYLTKIGTVYEPHEHCIYDFNSNPNKDEFISDLANKYSTDVNLDEIIVKLREKLRIGGYFLIKIKIPKNDHLSDFLLWFVQVFWQKFIKVLNGDSAVVAAISLDDSFEDNYLNEIFCDSEINGHKIMRLPLENWTQDDVFVWLCDHSGLRERGYDPTKFSEVADITTKGLPILTRSALFTNLERLLAEANQKEESS